MMQNKAYTVELLSRSQDVLAVETIKAGSAEEAAYEAVMRHQDTTIGMDVRDVRVTWPKSVAEALREQNPKR